MSGEQNAEITCESSQASGIIMSGEQKAEITCESSQASGIIMSGEQKAKITCESSKASEHEERFASFKHFDIVPEPPSDHHYLKSGKSGSKNHVSNQNSSLHKTIMKQWRILEANLPDSIYVQAYETRIDLLRAVIIGTSGTPYHDGLFFFDIFLPNNYPKQPPQVYYHAHGLRLNPNLYQGGKVCLSLLNTWNGSSVEKWRSSTSTILQVLVSIQGLVLNEEPYFNEPGYERHRTKRSVESMAYTQNAFSLSCKTMLYTMEKPPQGFEVFVNLHFRMRMDFIQAAIDEYQSGRVIVGRYQVDGSSTSSPLIQVPDEYKSDLMKLRYNLRIGLFKNTKVTSKFEAEKLKNKEKPKNEEKLETGNLSNWEAKINGRLMLLRRLKQMQKSLKLAFQEVCEVPPK